MKEMEAAEWSLSADDVRPILGASAAYIWTKQIKSQRFEKTVRDYDYRVEAGTARKPNKVNRVRQLNEFAQIAMPQLQQFAAQGNPGPYNALIDDWAKANDLDPARYMVAEEPGPGPEEQQQQQMQQQQQQQQAQEQQMQQQQQAQEQQMQAQAQAEQQKQQVEMQLKQMELQGKQLDMQGKQLDVQLKQDSLEIEKEKQQLELEIMREKKAVE
jgi:hypothetical protein